jgi:hypothetical protein
MDEEYEGQKIYAERSQVSLPSTGDARVDAAVAVLSHLTGTSADEHVAVLEEVHGQLRDILGELSDDSGQGQR